METEYLSEGRLSSAVYAVKFIMVKKVSVLLSAFSVACC